MGTRSISPPPRRRSPGPASSRGGANHDQRSRSPVSRSRRDDDRPRTGDRREHERDSDRDGYDRRDHRRREGESNRDRREHGGRRRSRSPARRHEGSSRDAHGDSKGHDRQVAAHGGDGGWGKRATSPGRPSQALPSQQALTGQQDGAQGDAPPAKPIEPNFQQSGALAAETKSVFLSVPRFRSPSLCAFAQCYSRPAALA